MDTDRNLAISALLVALLGPSLVQVKGQDVKCGLRLRLTSTSDLQLVPQYSFHHIFEHSRQPKHKDGAAIFIFAKAAHTLVARCSPGVTNMRGGIVKKILIRVSVGWEKI